MKKIQTRILLALIIIAVVGTAFPYVKKAVEIRSETRKWQEKWADRADATAPVKLVALAHATQVPEQITQDQLLSLAQSPWVIGSSLTIQQGATLSIEAGVEIFIAPRADIQVYGRILATGNKDQPIRLGAYSENQADAWAGIFIRSDEPSAFKYVDFAGSKYGARLVYSSASWDHCTFKNVREICSGYRSDFSFKNCLFDYRGYAGGGNINVMKFYKGFAHIEDCEFFCPDSDYKVDGIDADYMSGAIIRGNRFFGGKCDNSDAIDVGHGSRNILIENNLIVGFIDKAISVGEKAEAVVNNNFITGCAIGVGVKDRGRVTITRTTFYQNDYAVKSYEKVPGLGGGDVTLDHSVIARSQKSPVEADALSSIEISNSLCDSQLLPGSNNYQGTPKFVDVAEYNFNLKGVDALSGGQATLSLGEIGAKF
ncbi:MAG: right-handed parallel beta-helix repeat-containing protein [Desulfuromonadales bacterium]|nr:right-handed parallel beta-helix repeat-containing protein [Desulfuromonadales bacterium]